ncbi:riboflavin kinase/FMN adenylyltransferase [Breznakia blatticola]|uniref:Riboflavin biosynthesis protein n=1 Tax=Breznakia blatticola TaxID=1754012 RepID=A0A4V3G960_9FIRM|nr:bifunctional riboflavin kinase/FAD synthetase [Breznakia blatticola]TDW25567.1 riboflavin kinase/FMN adenylyltransferase [Breznakia blatticola]
MKIFDIYANKHYQVMNKTVACIGFFDGVHVGHQHLIKQTVELAKQKGLTPACITLSREPLQVLYPERDIKTIMDIEQRLQAIGSYGIQQCYLLHFDQAMANVSAADFIELLKSLCIDTIVAGEDFRFGKQNKGDVLMLEKQMPTKIIPLVELYGQKISSTTIIEALEKGEVEYVSSCMNRYYAIDGFVIHGNKVGSTKLGYPTANIEYNPFIVLPRVGVYIGRVIYEGKTYRAMINIGHNPTINRRDFLSLEAHILDFDQDIYGKRLVVEFSKYLRYEKKFNSKEELIEQLDNDVQSVRDYTYEIRNV